VTGLVGAIVAGGQAERFGGAPKGLHRVGGIRIIDRVAAALRAIAPELMVVSNSPDATRWLTAAAVYGDARTERGSLVGVHTALTHARQSVLVVAWDMPFVSAALLELIRDRAHDASFAVIPEGPSGLEPLCALYTRDCLPTIEAALDARDLRLSHVIARLPAVERIPTRDIEPVGDPAKLFFNVNSLDDLERADAMDAAG
jgi:molybdopterin-guanine dinucleotide biosynthesis protein A